MEIKPVSGVKISALEEVKPKVKIEAKAEEVQAEPAPEQKSNVSKLDVSA